MYHNSSYAMNIRAIWGNGNSPF